MGPSKCRAWCFTINNYTQDHWANLQLLVAADARPSYLVVGKEIGDSGTPHLQGYAHWANSRGFAGVKALLGGDAVHLEPARGSAAHNRTYCTKDGDFFEHGDIPSPGKRTDLHMALELLRESGSLKQVAEEHPCAYVRYSKGFSAFRNMFTDDRRERPRVVWLHGAPGAGKSRLARLEHGDQFWATTDGIWWDGYDQQHTVVVDDIDDKFTPALFKRLCDYYPMHVAFKGGMTKFNSALIIFTSVRDPLSHFAAVKENIEQLTRRIDVVCDVGEEFGVDFDWTSFDSNDWWKQQMEN